MSNEERSVLVEQANELGLEFAKNISTKKLAEMIQEAQGPAVKPEEELIVEAPATASYPGTRTLTKQQLRRKKISERKAAAMKTRIVTITNKDNRDNDFTTTASLSFENQFFGLAKNVPLDVPVELEQALIDIAESTIITHHKDEIVDGKRTGNKVPVSVKKYVVSYGKE